MYPFSLLVVYGLLGSLLVTGISFYFNNIKDTVTLLFPPFIFTLLVILFLLKKNYKNIINLVVFLIIGTGSYYISIMIGLSIDLPNSLQSSDIFIYIIGICGIIIFCIAQFLLVRDKKILLFLGKAIGISILIWSTFAGVLSFLSINMEKHILWVQFFWQCIVLIGIFHFLSTHLGDGEKHS